MATPEAVIEIGSTGVRLLVAELTPDRKRNTLDRAEMPVSLGRDVFSQGYISRETTLQCLHILQRYKEQLLGWGILPNQTTVIATSAFREAKNKDPVMDKILASTGFRVSVIDGIEENRLMYLAITECLKGEDAELRTEDTVILEVAGGSTELMLMKEGKMAGAHSLRLGTVRLEPKLRAQSGSFEDIQRYVKELTLNTKGSIESELNIEEVQQFVAAGSDATLAAIHAGKPISAFLWSIEREDFDRFTDEIQSYSIEEIVGRFKISFSDAQTLRISLLIYKMFIHLTKVKTIIVPETNIREGIFLDKTNVPNQELKEEFHRQITASAMSLLRKYHGDEGHAEFVRKTSLMIYDKLADEMNLDERSRLLLEVAAILHDIGIFIRLDDHNLHGAYIISHSEIFGLTHLERGIVAQIARYHRGKLQPQDQEDFQVLARANRMRILKLTAILRIADALDRSHSQSFTNLDIQLKNEALIIRTKGISNVSLERIALSEKGEMFESVFGYKLNLL